MRKEEKTERTRERILAAALEEFGTAGYDATALNTVCEKHGISKGLLYHNFKGKDDVYLTCVDQCFRSLTAHLADCVPDGDDPEERLKAYFTARFRFFGENPLYQRIFCDAVIFPPPQLQAEIRTIRRSFDRLNLEFLKRLIANLTLREGVSEQEVIETFQLYQDFINTRYQPGTVSDMRAHEQRCHRALNILLYGIIERK